MEPLPRSWLAFARSCMAMVSLPRSWQDLGKARKELAMDLGKGTMASNTGKRQKQQIENFGPGIASAKHTY